MKQENLLEVKQLRTEFFSSKTSSVTAVNEISFSIGKGEILGLVGESGCGKSVTSLSIIEAHEGSIRVEDNHPHGCIFTFTLPAEEVHLNE